MNDETDVRAWLATTEVPELRLDFAQTVRDGRAKAHRRRVRRVAGAGALALAAVLAVPGVAVLAQRDGAHPSPENPAASTPTSRDPNACEYHPLPLPDDPEFTALNATRVIANDYDPSGRYAVGFAQAAGENRLIILWDNGKPRLLPPQTKNGFPAGVNAKGQVLGKAGLNEFGALGSWVYRNGSIDRLGVPGGAVGHEIMGISAAGDVLGYLAYGGGPELQAKTVIWRAGALNTPEFLPAPRGKLFSTRLISADGTVIGELQPGRTPYVWAGGKGTELPVGTAPMLDAAGDWVAGADSLSGTVHRWQVSTRQGAPVTWPNLPGFAPDAVRVSADGSVIAAGRRSKTDKKLVVVTGDRVKDLPGPDGAFVAAESVNDDGTIVHGSVSVKPGDFPTFVYWTC